MQNQLEALSEINSRLEKGFEQNINEKNSHQKEVGMVINAINNISLISHSLVCQKKLKDLKPGMEYKKPPEPTMLSEKDPGLLGDLKERLDKATEQISDLIAV